LDVIGYDPSIEKVLLTLGVEAGSEEENEIRTAIDPPGIVSLEPPTAVTTSTSDVPVVALHNIVAIPSRMIVISMAALALAACFAVVRRMNG